MASSDKPASKRTRIAVIYGGRSTEHEISLQSAASVIANLDPSRYEIVGVEVDQQGGFHRHALTLPAPGQALRLPSGDSGAALPLAARGGHLLAADGGGTAFDVVFPVMHGPLCEDGSIQGLLELADVPYVGARVLGSAVCMDKDVAKRLVKAAGIPVVDYVTLRAPTWAREQATWIERIENELGYPCFVKPATLGSSVGVSRASTRSELIASVGTALGFDDKVLVERAVDAREIEFAVLAAEDEASPPEVSVPGEIAPRADFYSFERKYLDAEGADLHVPAQLEPELLARGRDAAQRIFTMLECEGMARIDFFLDRRSGQLYFNEVNTIPGFTAISMYPKLWEASGLPYARLLDRLVEDARRRHGRRSKLRRER